jgi:phage gp29-like protein
MVMALVDQYGRPIDTKALKEEKAGPSTTGVRQVISGHPAQGLTPLRLAGILRDAEEGDATRYLELAEEMEEKDLHYQSVMGTRKRQVAQLTVTVEPASDSPEDVKNAELVEQFLRRDELEDEMFDILDAVGKGYSVTEILWETSERQWMPQRLEWRYPQWFEFDRDTGAKLLRRDDAAENGGLVELEPFKFILHRVRAKSGLTIRGGLARVACWSYLFKNYDIKDWVQFVETYGQPLRVGKYPASASPADRDTLLRAVANIAADAAAIIPEGMTIEFIKDTTARATSEIYQSLAVYLDAQISKAVLGQTLTTQEGSSGSYSLGKVHDEVRGDIERADAKVLAGTLNRDLVRPIVDLNRGPQKAYPKICIGRDEEVNVQELADALAKLVPVGLRVSESEVRAKIGLSEPDDKDDVLGAPPAAEPGTGKDDTATARARAARRPAPPRDRVDDLADEAEAEARAAGAALIDRIRDLVDGAESLEEISEGLLELYPGMDIEQLGRRMGDALVVAELMGRSDLADGK